MIGRLRALRHNPIARAETRYIRRSDPNRLHRVLRRLSLLAAIVACLIALSAGALRDFELTMVFNVLVVVAIVAWLLVSLKTVSAAIESVNRERLGRTWDQVILTGVDARRMVLGKWWGVLRGLAWDYVVLLLLRTALLIWPRQIYVQDAFGSAYVQISPKPIMLVGSPLLVLLDVSLVAALGLAMGLVYRSARQSTFVAVAARMLLALAGLLILGVFEQVARFTGYYPLLSGSITYMDSGLSAILSLSVSYDLRGTLQLLLGMLVGMSVYLASIVAALRAAQWAAFRQGFVSPGEQARLKRKSKTKRESHFAADDESLQLDAEMSRSARQTRR